MHRITDSRFVLAVRNLKESTDFYMNALGFQRDFGDGSDGWSFLSRDNFKVMLGECTNEKAASELGNHSYFAYLIVEGVDELHAELSRKGVDVISPPKDKPWGLRELAVRTPDGHRMTFGQPLPTSS